MINETKEKDDIIDDKEIQYIIKKSKEEYESIRPDKDNKISSNLFIIFILLVIMLIVLAKSINKSKTTIENNKNSTDTEVIIVDVDSIWEQNSNNTGE